MTKRQATKPKPQREMPSLYPCMHCGTERVVLPWVAAAAFNRKHPLPWMADALIELRLHLPSRDTLVGICPSCFCLAAAEYDGHDH